MTNKDNLKQRLEENMYQVFIDYECGNCGSQRCEGPGSEWGEGCVSLQAQIKNLIETVMSERKQAHLEVLEDLLEDAHRVNSGDHHLVVDLDDIEYEIERIKDES